MRVILIDIKDEQLLKHKILMLFVLAIHYFPQLKNTKQLWIEMGHTTATVDNRCYLPVHELCSSMSPTYCRILPAVHALTGCDSISSFNGIGKKTVINILTKDIERWKELSDLSNTTTEAITASKMFVIELYRKGKTQYNSVNDLRVALATSKEPSLAKLPPCEASLLQHINRAAFQVKV